MLQMQAQAELLRQQPQGNSADARTQLEQSLKTELGSSAQLQWLGNRAQVSLSNAATPALARWLAQVRDNSHASVAEMKLNRNLGESVDGAAVTRWSGNLLLDLPDNAGAQN